MLLQNNLLFQNNGYISYGNIETEHILLEQLMYSYEICGQDADDLISFIKLLKIYQVRGLNEFQIPQVFLNQNIDQGHLNIVTNRREQARHQIRNEEVKTFLNRKRKLQGLLLFKQTLILHIFIKNDHRPQ
ncbi:hypothetical protein pb186bvf_018148 [Paramecium bursaria]